MSAGDVQKLLTPLILRGGAALPCRLLPGPMEAVTDGAWITQLTAHKYVTSWWTPFLRISTGVPRPSRLAAHLKPFLTSGLPFIAQLMGTDGALLAAAAKGLFAAGATAVDLNCACPMAAVTANGAGGACLRNPSWIRETLQRMRAAVGDRPIGVKVRMGWQETSEFTHGIAPALREAAPDFVTVHFRTVHEQYHLVPDGLVRMAAAREELPGMTLIGSGDLFTPQDIVVMAEQCGVDAVAPARGLLRNPRLLAETAALLRGTPLPPFNDDDRRDFLSGCAADGAPHGFLLQMAANLYGKASSQFNDFLAHLTAIHQPALQPPCHRSASPTPPSRTI